MQGFFKKLKNCSTIESLKKCILRHFLKEGNGAYIPAIVKYTLNNKNQKYRFFAKLIVQPKEKSCKSGWQRQNLKESLPMQAKLKENLNIHNVITQVNFKGKKVYAVNRHFSSVENMRMTGEVQNNILLEYYQNTRYPILQETSNGDSIFIYKKFMQTLLEKIFFNRYTLALDFYICFPKMEFVKDKKMKYLLKKEKNAQHFYGNLVVDSQILTENIDRAKSNILVYNLLEKNFTPLHKYPLQMQTDMGLIFFSLDILEYLKANFYNYGLYLVSRQTKQVLLVDILDECVTFWKSEFLKLTEIEQKKFEKLNRQDCPNTFISQAMYMWQIEGKMEYTKYMPAYQALADYLFQNCKERLLKSKISFFLPQNLYELQKSIQNLLQFFSITLKDLRMKQEQEQVFEEILQGVCKPDLNIDRYYNGFCYILQRRIEDETIAM